MCAEDILNLIEAAIDGLFKCGYYSNTALNFDRVVNK